MPENKTLTQQFLEEMDYIFPNNCIYTLKDVLSDGEKNAAIHISKAKIADQNSIKNKRGVYFTPNGDFALAKGKRTKDNAKKIYCFFGDNDEGEEFWERFPLDPSIIVKTKRGYHAYWLLDVPSEDYKSWEEIMSFMCDYVGMDNGAKDLARIMRLPGSRYWKDNKGEFEVRVIKYDPTIRHKMTDFKAIFTSNRKIKRDEDKIRRSVDRDSAALFEDINMSLDVRDVLCDLYGSRWDVRENGSIYEGGKLTGGYKWNKSGNYLNTFSPHEDERPQGGPFAIAKFYYKGNVPEAFNYFRERWGIGEIIKTASPQIKQDKENHTITYVTDKGEIIFDLEQNTTRYITGNSDKLLFEGVLIPLGYYEVEGIAHYIVEYRKVNGEKGVIEMSELGRGGWLSRYLSQIGLTIMIDGKIFKTAFLISYIHSTDNRLEYIDKLGVYSQDLVINKHGKYFASDNKGKYYVNIDENLPKNPYGEYMTIGEKSTNEDIINVISKLKEQYDEKIICSMFTRYAMALFSHAIRQKFGFFPVSMLVGLTQSGKTVTRHTMMDLFGIDKSLEVNAGITEFIAMKRARHYLPMNVGEFLNDDIKFSWDNFLKNNYDNTSNERGTADQSSLRYEANSPVIIDGESRSMTNSVYSRTICFFMNPHLKKGKPQKFTNINKYFIDNFEYIHKLPELFGKNHAILSNSEAGKSKQERDRIIDNYAMLLGFAECFGFLNEVKDPIMDQFESQFNMMGEDNVNKTIRAVMTLAVASNFVCEFEDDTRELRIDFEVDTLRINKAKIDDMKSNIQTVNHHFHNMESASSESLYIPMDHIFKSKELHLIFNKLLDHIYKEIDVGGPIKLALLQYLHTNNYKKSKFYNWHKEGMDGRATAKNPLFEEDE